MIVTISENWTWVLFRQAFRIAPKTSALAFAVIVLASLALFSLAGRVSQ